jgi:hypothetical protein
MKAVIALALLTVGLACPAGAADELFDRVEEALSFNAADAQVRGRISGLFDLEGYNAQLPPPGVIQAPGGRVFVPRLSVFLDLQAGRRVYFFAQARADRGFDPEPEHLEARLDEYALRITPFRGARFNVQLGKFATVVGNWTARHASWANPFITAPLPYEYLTGVWDTEAVRASGVLLQWSHVRPGLAPAVIAEEKYQRLPIVWGPNYTTGVAVSGDVGRWRYAAEMKLGSLSSRPDIWQHGWENRRHPTVGARVGYRPNQMWDIGISASSGPYLREFADRTTLAGHGRGDYRQNVIAQDVSFAWHHLQVWTEIYAARFQIPRVGSADTLAYYAEAKYKFTPQFFGALRWNQQLFATIADRAGPTRWGHDVWRIDVAPGYRFTPHTQLKLQYSLQHGDSGSRDYTRLLALQATMRF